MGIIKDLQDFFTSKTKESTSTEQWKDLEQRSGRGQRVNSSVQDVQELLDSDKVQIQPNQNANSIDIAQDKEIEMVKIIPATEEQKNQYSLHMDGQESIYWPQYDFPVFSKEQLNSVPDVIEGVHLSDYEKKLLLLNDLEYTHNDVSYKIDENNNLEKTFLDEDLFSQTIFITKDQISFYKEENNKIYFNQEEDRNFNNELLEDLQEEFLSERQLFAQLDRENYDETMLPGYQEDIAEKQYNHEMLEIESINNEIYKTEEYKKLISSYSIEYPEIGREIEKVHQAMHEGKDLTPYQENIIDKYDRFFSNLNEALNDLGLKSDGTYHTDCFDDVIKDRFNVLNQNLENKNLVNSVLNKTQEKTIPLPDNIYDFTITGDIKQELLKGKGVIGNIKGTDYFIRLPNKDQKNKNNLQILSIEKAKEFGLVPKENKNHSKSIKI